VFDIGSGSTKSKAYIVDICKNKLIKTLKEINKHIKYQDCISKSPDKKTITKACLTEGLNAIKEIKKEYGINCKQEQCAGVATAWARNAKNAKELLDLFKKENVHIYSISQNDEGELGFATAVNDLELKGVNPQNIVVWDIGGGSFQLAALDEKGILNSYDGKWGIFNLFQEVRKKFPKEGCSPDKERFFGKDELEKILQYVAEQVGVEVKQDKFIINKISNQKVRVIGIGRIMYLGLRYQLGLINPIPKEKIKELIYKFADKTIEDAYHMYPKLPPHFVSLIQQSLILIWGIMESAGIDQIEIVNSTLTDHVALDEDYWKVAKNYPKPAK
jgi:exopolyphosphatase/guanosine-5'-triphosphate,3'-diphosphate pyrophosphatase